MEVIPSRPPRRSVYNRVCFSHLLLVFCLVGAHAHDRSFHLNQGEFALDIKPGGDSGSETYLMLNADGQTLRSGQFVLGIPQLGPTWLGDYISVEAGLTNVLSLGFKTGLVFPWINLSATGDWTFPAAVTTTFDGGRALGIEDDWGLYWTEELQLDPLYSNNVPASARFMNLFSTLSTNRTVVRSDGGYIAVYLDTRLISTFRHPYYGKEFLDDDYVQSLKAYYTVPNGFKIPIVGSSKLVFASGMEMAAFQHFVFSCGVEVSVARIYPSLAGGLILQRDDSHGQYALPTGFEFELRYRF